MQTVLGRYEVRAQISAGPLSTVYEGWDTSIERRVAIKSVTLTETGQSEGWQQRARFRREAQAAGRLQHPNVVAIFDYGESADAAYIVMEFVEGTTLKAAIEKKSQFSISETGRLVVDILAGLQYSHDRGIVHRDLKPSNIMVTRDGQAKIADFGIARFENSDMTEVGTVMGTPSYMSPEQFLGEEIDARTDIYSVGVILYQLLTGEQPFTGGLATIMHKALNSEPPSPSVVSKDVPKSFDSVVSRAMSKRPDQRFRDAKEFARALGGALERISSETARPTPALSALGKPFRSATSPARTFLVPGVLLATAVAAISIMAYQMSSPTVLEARRPLAPEPGVSSLDSVQSAPSTPAGSAVRSPSAAADVSTPALGQSALSPATPPTALPSSAAPDALSHDPVQSTPSSARSPSPAPDELAASPAPSAPPASPPVAPSPAAGPSVRQPSPAASRLAPATLPSTPPLLLAPVTPSLAATLSGPQTSPDVASTGTPQTRSAVLSARSPQRPPSIVRKLPHKAVPPVPDDPFMSETTRQLGTAGGQPAEGQPSAATVGHDSEPAIPPAVAEHETKAPGSLGRLEVSNGKRVFVPTPDPAPPSLPTTPEQPPSTSAAKLMGRYDIIDGQRRYVPAAQ